jgi:hypothetical protein
MSFVAKKLMDGGYLTKEQVAEAEKRAEAFVDEISKNPELFLQSIEKLGAAPMEASAPFWERFKGTVGESLPGVLGAALITGGLGFGANLGIHGIKALKSKIDKARGYKAMLEESPHLKEFDPNLTQTIFSTLHRFNPAYASDPFVAAQFVRTVAEQERMDLGALNNIVNAHKSMTAGGGSGAMDFFSGISGKGMMDPTQAALNRLKLKVTKEDRPHQHQKLLDEAAAADVNRQKAEEAHDQLVAENEARNAIQYEGGQIK